MPVPHYVCKQHDLVSEVAFFEGGYLYAVEDIAADPRVAPEVRARAEAFVAAVKAAASEAVVS